MPFEDALAQTIQRAESPDAYVSPYAAPVPEAAPARPDNLDAVPPGQDFDPLQDFSAAGLADFAKKNSYQLEAALAERPELQENPEVLEKVRQASRIVSGTPTPLNESQVAQGDTFDVFRDFDAAGIAQFAKDHPDEFSLVEHFKARPELQSDPVVKEKLAEAYNMLRIRALEHPLEGVMHGGKAAAAKRTLSAIWGMGKGYVETLNKLGQAALLKVVRSTDPEMQKQIDLEAKKAAGESIASTESALLGVAHAATRAGDFVARSTGLALHPRFFSPEQKARDFEDALAASDVMEKSAKGEGILSATETGRANLQALKDAGIPIDPQAVSEMSAGSPYALWMYGRALQSPVKLTPAPVRAIVSHGLAKAETAAEKAASALIGGTARTAQAASLVAEKTAKPVTAVAAASKGLVLGGPAGAAVGLKVGAEAGEKFAEGAAKVKAASGAVADSMRLLRTEGVATGPVTQAVSDLARSVPQTIVAGTHGALFDAAFAATTAITPEEKTQVGIGTGLAMLGAAKGAGKRVLSGQIIGKRPWGSSTSYAPPRSYDLLSNLEAETNTAPGLQERVGAIRSIGGRINPNAEVYSIPFPEAGAADPLPAALSAIGVDPSFANANGFKTTTPDGKTLVIFRKLDAAPHEVVGHVMEDVMGEAANRDLDAATKASYTPQEWAAYVDEYARKLARSEGGIPRGMTPEQYLLMRTGWASDLVMEKLVGAVEASAEAQGVKLTQEELRAAVSTGVEEILKSGDPRAPLAALTAEEQQGLIDRYVAREIRADHSAAWYKHTGGKFERPWMEKAARFVADLTEFLGGEPLEGRAEDMTPLRYGLLKATEGAAAKSIKPTVEPSATGKKSTARPQVVPTTLEEQQAQEQRKAEEVVNNAPDEMLPGADQSVKEILGTLWQAAADRAGVNMEYMSAPGSPPASGAFQLFADAIVSREKRRQLIEDASYLPESVRELYQKTFVPVMVRKSSTGYQVNGWAPQVFAANAQKLAMWAAERPTFRPDLFGSGGRYEVDAAAKTFTPQAWDNVMSDAATVSANHMAGRTGSGKPLIVPRETGPGYFQPPLEASAASLPQAHADVINALIGYKTPTTGIVASEGKIPLNLAGQRTAEATMPGRLGPKGPEFGSSGKKSRERAVALGITGETVRETNPFKQELKDAKGPSFIEANQWLNVDRIKNVQVAPEQPQLRVNSLTAASGFKPAGTSEERVRLFSGRGGAAGAGQGGAWWSRNARRAASFGPELSTVSVPESIAKAGEAEARRLGSGTAGDVVLPDEWVRRAQELGVVDQPTYAIAEGMSAQFKTREKEPPKKTQIAYKLFRVKKSEPGVLYPLFVDAKQPVEIGKWLDAEDTQSVVAKDGRKRVIAHKIGKKTELADGTFVNTLAYRPGWHSGDIPYASHIGKKDKATGKIVARKADEVWAEVEVSADRDFQPDANANGQREGKFVAGDADLDFIPEDGFYRYKTNPNMTGDWIISGAIKVKRVLGEAEVNKLLTDAGVKPMPWDKGPLDLKKLGFDETPLAKPVENTPESRLKKLQTEFYTIAKAPAGKEARMAELIREIDGVKSSIEEEGRSIPDFDYAEFERISEQQWLDSIDASKYEAKGAAEPQTPEAMFEARRKSKKITQEALPHAAAGEEINVVHLSDTPGLTEIDPAKMGSAKATPRDMRGTPKSFWFVEKSPLGQDVNEFGKAGKQAYGTTLRGERIYDLRGDKNDVLGYFSEPNREAADRNLVEKGYAGVITDTPDGRQVVMLFKRAKVAPLKPTKAATKAPRGVLHSEMVQFAAPDDPNPRKIRAAIVWDPKTGKHWEGPMHFVAMQRAAMDGIPPTELMGLTQGFIDGLGAKLTREEAFIRAQELEQLKPVDVRMEAGEVSKSDKRLVSEETQFKPRDLVTPEREEQFKESKVRFADGTLKPVFHGTTTEPEKVTGFSTIGFNAHFGGPGQAATRTVGPWETRSAKAKESMATARTVPVFLDIKNPLRVSQDPADWTNPTSVAASLRKAGVKSENLRTDYVNRRVDSEVSDLMDAGYDEQTANALANQAVVEELKQVLVEKGYDGIDYNNQFESETPLLLTRPKQLSAMEEGRFPSYLDEGQKMKYEGRKDYDDGSSYIPFYPEQIRHALTGEQAVQFKSAELKDFSDETKLSDALKSSDWAILTWNREDLGAATDAKNIAANEKLSRMLQAAGLEFLEVEGEYKGIDQGKNFLVVGITPKEALSLGKFGKQESVIVADGLLYMDGKIQPTDHSKNVIGDEAVKTGVWSRVKGGPAFSLGIAEAKQDYTLPTPEPYPTQHTLPPSKPLLTSKEIEAMTTEQAREHFPEGVFPDRVKNRAGKMVDPQVTSNHKKSPLFRRAKNEAEAVELYADELVKEHEQWKNHPDYQSGLKWYSEFTPKMTAHFGKHSQIFAELLSATSPNNQPKPNFFYAVDALSMYKAGRYDAMLKKFQEGIELLEKNRDEAMAYTEKRYNETGRKIPKAGLAEENFILQWIQDHNLIPRQSNGQRFGMHSIAVLKVLARRWLTDNSGPKTLNFIKNLVGTGNEATVDVWADRTLRRIGYRERKRWRITPRNSTGIPDVDFFFGQKVFRRAAEKIGIEPSALQGGLWFSEKRLWADQGWGRLDLGDYRTEMRNIADIQAKVDKRMSPPQQSLNLVSPRPTP